MATVITSATRWERFADHMNIGTFVFALLHLAPISAFWLGVRWSDVGLMLGVYFVQAFGIAAGYHRYFSHRAYSTSRLFQAILAFLGTLSGQRGVLWWVQHHRHHHRYADTCRDIHSPSLQGLLYTHSGWGFDRKVAETRLDRVPDLAGFPELVWLDRHSGLIFLGFGGFLWLVFGVRGLVYGFCCGTLLSWHAVSCIVSLSHSRLGTRRYATPENSKNIWWLALWTMGEAWHNNHHYFPTSARQGFYWWEFDATYLLLRVLSVFGIVWDLRTPPVAIRDRRDPEYDPRMLQMVNRLNRIPLRLNDCLDRWIVSNPSQAELESATIPRLRQMIDDGFDGLQRTCFEILLKNPAAWNEHLDQLSSAILKESGTLAGTTDLVENIEHLLEENQFPTRNRIITGGRQA